MMAEVVHSVPVGEIALVSYRKVPNRLRPLARQGLVTGLRVRRSLVTAPLIGRLIRLCRVAGFNLVSVRCRHTEPGE